MLRTVPSLEWMEKCTLSAFSDQPPGDSQSEPSSAIGRAGDRTAIARLRDALTALKVHGTCRHVAYELLTYWEPGGLRCSRASRPYRTGLGSPHGRYSDTWQSFSVSGCG